MGDVHVRFSLVDGSDVASYHCAGIPRLGDRVWIRPYQEGLLVVAVEWVADSEGVMQPHVTLDARPHTNPGGAE